VHNLLVTSQEILDRARFARELAQAAGRVARSMQPGIEAREKEDGSGPVTAADLASEKAILDGLAERYPDDPIISEESGTTGTPGRGFVWCVDPLDGTREYSQGRDDFAVMVGLLHDGVPVAGAVGIPAEDKVVWGAIGEGAWVEDTAVAIEPIADLAEATLIHTRSHVSPKLATVIEKLAPKRTVAAGSAGYKVAHILAGKAHVYVHPSRGTKWWDSVAPAALILAIGGEFGNAKGEPIVYEGDREHLDGLMFTAPGLAASVRECLRVLA
jgi:3'(2'), 5'-bisphosphate nucleotidase